jgi:ABC-2 type transport system ATP-binding protein
LESARRRKTLDSIEEFTNLTGIRHKTLKSLSKGMNQRVCLARALLHDPKVLILDEPAAGLDPRARIELRELIRVFSAQGKAILMSSHILTELSEICTGAVIIERGRVLKAGKLDDLLLHDEATRTIVIRLADKSACATHGGTPCSTDTPVCAAGIDALHRSLLEMPGTRDVRVDDDEVTVDYAGSDAEASELLAELIRRGHRIAEFRQQRANLEQLFMNVTTGGVQ